jgi:hypothetical protein
MSKHYKINLGRKRADESCSAVSSRFCNVKCRLLAKLEKDDSFQNTTMRSGDKSAAVAHNPTAFISLFLFMTTAYLLF